MSFKLYIKVDWSGCIPRGLIYSKSQKSFHLFNSIQLYVCTGDVGVSSTILCSKKQIHLLFYLFVRVFMLYILYVLEQQHSSVVKCTVH